MFFYDVMIFDVMQLTGKWFNAIIMILSELTASGSAIMILNLPTGSILQWGMGCGLLCLLSLVVTYFALLSIMRIPYQLNCMLFLQI